MLAALGVFLDWQSWLPALQSPLGGLLFITLIHIGTAVGGSWLCGGVVRPWRGISSAYFARPHSVLIQ